MTPEERKHCLKQCKETLKRSEAQDVIEALKKLRPKWDTELNKESLLQLAFTPPETWPLTGIYGSDLIVPTRLKEEHPESPAVPFSTQA